MDTLYRGEQASILVDTLVMAGKDGQSDMTIAPPSGTSIQMEGVRSKLESLAADRLVIKSDSGTVFLGTGGGTLNINLPEGGSDDGIEIGAIADSTTTVRVRPVGTENIIYTGGAMTNGEYLELSSNAKLSLVSTGGGSWVAVLESGTLTEETP